jgi:3-deoxy-D-manno-octulosonic-acid transferase
LRYVYYTLAVLLYIAALPFLIYLRFKPKYTDSIPARFFLKHNPPFECNGIWFHACSLGEVRSLTPLIERLDPKNVRISVITQTGFQEACRYKGVQARYLPFEIFLPFWMRSQKVLIVMEAELWPLLFVVAKAKGIKTVLLNARISDNSYASYMKFAWFYRWIFRHIDLVLAQSAEDKERLNALGARNVEVSGNLKQYQRYRVSKPYAKDADKRLIVLASTHEKEEAMILEALPLRQNDQIVIVPRHPERFEKVGRYLREFASNHHRSFGALSQNERLDADVILCDKMGELINLYAAADIVILGGSFVEGIGGHNPLEPAFFGVKLISGEFVFNQKVLFAAVENMLTCKIETLGEIFQHIDEAKPSRINPKEGIEPLLEKLIG